LDDTAELSDPFRLHPEIRPGGQLFRSPDPRSDFGSSFGRPTGRGAKPTKASRPWEAARRTVRGRSGEISGCACWPPLTVCGSVSSPRSPVAHASSRWYGVRGL